MPKGVYARKSAAERIREHIVIDEEKGCWVWQKTPDKDGYGQISDGCKTRQTHKVMYEAVKGKVPDGLVLSHLCDEKYPKESKAYRLCCNPEHLMPDTPQGNTARMVELGRSVVSAGAFKKGECSGEDNKHCLLSDQAILEIYNKTREKLPYGGLKKIAVEYEVSYILVQKISGGTYPRLIELLKKHQG